MTRFEPATSGSTDRRSNQLSYIHHKMDVARLNHQIRKPQSSAPPYSSKLNVQAQPSTARARLNPLAYVSAL